MKFLLGMIILPSVIYLLGSATSSSKPFTPQSFGGKPSFHPHVEETDEGYGLHLVDEQLDLGQGGDSWGIGKFGLGKVIGKKRPLILITGGAGQMGKLMAIRR